MERDLHMEPVEYGAFVNFEMCFTLLWLSQTGVCQMFLKPFVFHVWHIVPFIISTQKNNYSDCIHFVWKHRMFQSTRQCAPIKPPDRCQLIQEALTRNPD